ncbi:ABC transporter substrate-binding protein [Streptomyces sp. SID12501]|uniref:ABC transporter substrate-binding protein n=1 Tax=Streptomyces sp. SID12501 TaxID=2706042 RepID=A0A6B3BYZ0_9ACTN|nr:ABC transporter substrate-binding protein [Streptomyces sp. SID12501]NEC89621.1 ABC transporter substrate-binding protein [Streptomyces sp. SID12501]
MKHLIKVAGVPILLCVAVFLVLEWIGSIDFIRTEDRLRIVSLSPSATEILYSLGAGVDVVAVDPYSDYPEAARKKKDQDLDGASPEVKDVMAYEPDLVIVPGYQGPEGEEAVTDLRERKVDVLVDSAPRDLEGAYLAIQDLGDKVDRSNEARKVVGSMKSKIDEIVAEADAVRKEAEGEGKGGRDGKSSYYHEVDSNYISLTSRTFAGSIYSLFGLENIADQYEEAGNGYPTLKAAEIISADPGMIFLVDGQTLETVRARAGWHKISAVREGKVVELNGDLCSRWGPRLVDFVREVSEILDAGS